MLTLKNPLHICHCQGISAGWTQEPETTQTSRWNAANTAGTLSGDGIKEPLMMLKTWPVASFSVGWFSFRWSAGLVSHYSQFRNQCGKWKGTNNHSEKKMVMSFQQHTFNIIWLRFPLNCISSHKKIGSCLYFRMNVAMMWFWCPRMTATIMEAYNCTTVSWLMRSGYRSRFVILPDYKTHRRPSNSCVWGVNQKKFCPLLSWNKLQVCVGLTAYWNRSFCLHCFASQAKFWGKLDV